jgi:hypothetical protein
MLSLSEPILSPINLQDGKSYCRDRCLEATEGGMFLSSILCCPDLCCSLPWIDFWAANWADDFVGTAAKGRVQLVEFIIYSRLFSAHLDPGISPVTQSFFNPTWSCRVHLSFLYGFQSRCLVLQTTPRPAPNLFSLTWCISANFSPLLLEQVGISKSVYATARQYWFHAVFI